MSSVRVNVVVSSDGLFDRHAAAAHCAFTLEAFEQWLRRGLIPNGSADGWPQELLDQVLADLAQRGCQHDNPTRLHSQFKKIPHCQRIWKKLEQGDGAGHWLFYFRPTGERLPASWGSPDFMSALIECERRYAAELHQFAAAAAHENAQQLAASPTEAPTELIRNQSPTAAQPSQLSTSNRPEFVTQNSVGRGYEFRAGGVLKISRRRAAITQADIARVIRAAKQAGAAEVEVRLAERSTIVIRLQPSPSPDIPLASNEEIVL